MKLTAGQIKTTPKRITRDTESGRRAHYALEWTGKEYAVTAIDCAGVAVAKFSNFADALRTYTNAILMPDTGLARTTVFLATLKR